MTAEIAVMNKGAIALAADSKVTVTTGGVTKTYDTVSKLFTLSKTAPVGIMVYGNADFMGYPWETVIKLYRREKGAKTERTIAKWATDFFLFLRKFGNISKDDREHNVYSICLSTLFEAIKSFEDSALYNGISHGTPEYETGLRSALAKKAESAAMAEPWANKRQIPSLVKRFAPYISQAIVTLLEGYNEETKKEAARLIVATLIFQEGSPQVSGIVIAGFGDSEYFPTLVEYRTDGYVGEGIKSYLVKPMMDIDRAFTGCIRSFAQGEMVQRFMDGIDPVYSMYLSRAIPEIVVDNCFQTLEKYGTKASKTEAVKQNIRSAVLEAVNGFETDARSYRSDWFSDPVIRMVSVLPKDELANLAESLVALTSLKRRVSSDAETVGGPIDVALISKGDGFVWIKRKHYFEEKLNQQFIRNYMNDAQYGEKDHARPAGANGSSRAAIKRPTRQAKPKRTDQPASDANDRSG